MKQSVWVHPREFMRKPTCDALLDKCAEHFSDLHAYLMYGDGCLVARNDGLFESRPERVDGAWPFDYLLDGAHRRGMRVHAVWSVGGWWVWSRLNVPLSPEWNCANRPDGPLRNWLDLSIPAAREFVAGVVEAIAGLHPGMDGITLDYIRYSSSFQRVEGLSEDDITETVRLVREVTTGHDLGAATNIGYRMVDCKQDWPLWVAQDLIDTSMVMCYRYMADMAFPNHLALLEPYDKSRIHPIISTRPRDGVPLTNEELEQETLLVEEGGYAGVSYFSASNLQQVPEHWQHLPLRETIGGEDMALKDRLEEIGARLEEMEVLLVALKASAAEALQELEEFEAMKEEMLGVE